MKAKAKKSVRPKRKPVARKSAQSAATKKWHGFRAVELEWMNKNPDKLRPYAGEYVIVEGTRLVAHSADAGEAIAAAKRQGIKIPFVLFLEVPKPNTVRIGL